MPAFFETFPVILIDQGGTVRADIPFRRAESRYSIEQTSVVLYFSGGILNGTEYSTQSLVKDYFEAAQFGSYLHLNVQQVIKVMVFSEHLHEVGIHFHTQLSHSYFSLDWRYYYHTTSGRIWS